MKRRLLILGAIALAALGTTPAYARRFRMPRGGGLRGGRKTYGEKHLTQDKLERCLLQGSDLNRSEASLAESEARVIRMQAEFEELHERLEAEGRRVDKYSQASIDAYNVSVARYEAARHEFNAAVDLHNGSLNSFNAAVSQYNAACADRLYYEDDMEAARAAVGVFD